MTIQYFKLIFHYQSGKQTADGSLKIGSNICVVSIRKLSCYKDGKGSKHPGKLFCLKCPYWLEINKKKFESEKRFMHKLFSAF